MASEKDQQIQQAYIDDFQKRSKIAKEEYKNQFTNFMGELDWSQLGTNQANQLSTGLQKLSEKTAFTMQQLSSKAREATRQANEAFKDTGAINTYGKALQKIAEDSGKFDIQSWSGYLDEVNARFEAGAMTTEQYSYSLGIMADTMSSMTGVPASVFETALKGTGDLEVAFQNATTGLNNFLSAYGKSTMDLEMGDSIAESLTQQFEDLLQFGNDFDLTLEKEGKIECSWLVQQKDSLDLPKQMEDMIDLVVADGEVTEVEQKVLMGVQTEIKNEGQLKDETVKTIEGLLDGTLEIDKGIEIAGIKLNAQEAEQLKQSLQEAGISAKDLKLGDTGIEKAEQQAQALEQELSKISDTEIRLAIEEQGFDSAEKVQNLVSVLETVPEEKKTQFIADTGEYFNNANSVEEAIKSMPDELKIKYNVGVEGDERLESLKSTFDSLPESIQTKIGVENGEYTVDQIQMIKEMVDQFGETDANAFLSIEGAPEALAECTTVEEFLQRLQEMVVEGKVTITAETEEAENAEETLNELDGEEATATVNTELNEGAYNKLQEALDKIHGEDGKQTQSTYTIETDTKKLDEATKKLDEADGKQSESNYKTNADTKELDEATKKLDEADGKQSESNYKTNADTKELDEATQKLDEANGKQSESNYKANADTKELDEATKKLDETDGKQTQSNYKANADTSELKEAEKEINNLTTNKNGTVTLTVSGKEQIQATINDKKQLEVNGQAVTTVQIAGGEQYSVAINEKGQLEVNGVAQTQIDVSGSDQLVLAKNEKGQLEVNGQAVTDIQVNGKEEVSQAKQEVDNLTKEGNKNVSINIDISLKETVGEILSRLGLNKKTEKVELKVTCTDEATPKINKILQNNNKPVTFKMNADSANVDNTVKKVRDLGASPISIKLNCNADQVTTVIQNIRSVSSKPFTFSVTAPGASEAYNSISKIQNIQASPKSFTVTAPGSSDAYNAVLKIKNCTIGNKRFTVTAPGSRDAYNAVLKIKNTNIPPKRFTITAPGSAGVISALSTIKSKLDSIHGKAIRVSVTTVYKTVGTPSKEGGRVIGANEPEIIKLAKPSFGHGATTQALSGTTQALSGEIQAINNNAETLNNAVSTTNNSAELMASKKVKANIDTSKTIDAVKRNIDLLTNMSNLLSKLATQIDTLQAKQQRTWGSRTIKLLKQQISLLTKQQSLTKVNIKNMEGMSKKLKSSLKKSGFKFKDDGTISNYNSKLLAMEKNVERLEKKEEKYNKKHKDTSKLSKKKQKAVDKQQEANSKATEKARKKLDETKQKLQEYYDLQFSKLPNAKKDWEEYANAIADAKAEIIKADREARTFFENAKEERLNFQIDKSSTKADTYMTKSDMSKSWKESVKWIKKANKELEKNKARQKEISKTAKSRAKDNKKILSKQGFKFNSDGSIKGAEKKLESLRKKLSTQEYEATKEAYDEYMQDIYETIPKAEEEWYKLREEIEENKKSIEETNKAMQELVDNSALTQLTGKYDRLSDTLDLVNAKMEQAHGKHKLSYMQGQMNLLERMDAEQKKMVKENQDLAKASKKKLSKMGINFTADGDITNLETIMKNLKKNGTLEDMEKLQEEVDKYNDALKNVRDGNKTIADNENSINDLKDSIIELNKEFEDIQNDAWATEFENDIKVIQNRLDNLDAQLELSNGNQIDLLNEKIKTYKELAMATESSLLYKRDRAMELGKRLSLEYGFKVNDDGTIDNTAERLTELKNSLSDTEFDTINDYLQEYFDVALDEIPELEKQLLEYQKDLKDIEKEKLETTKKIEDEITKVYEKQIEERIDKINEEKDAQVKALNEANNIA